MENDRIAKKVYAAESAGSHSVGSQRKRWIDTVKACLKKGGLDVRQARRMVHNRIVWQGFARENALDVDRGINLDFDEMPQL